MQQRAAKIPKREPLETAKFTAKDHDVWQAILRMHQERRDKQIYPLFLEGVAELGITDECIPELDPINQILAKKSGFQGELVKGLELGDSFYPMLGERRFPIGNFIRSGQDLGYTPEPDIVHDLYGHLPFFISRRYGDFCQALGAEASRYLDRPDLLRQFERFFWFTIEFALIRTAAGLRIFGAGIASSVGECDYALGDAPTILPFDVDRIRKQEFRIDIMQPILFCLDSEEQLYGSLDDLFKKIRADR